MGSKTVANHPFSSSAISLKMQRVQYLGEVAEWLKAPHSKCGIRVTVSGVRIPPSPPISTFADIHKSAEIGRFIGIFRLYTFIDVRHNPQHDCGLIRGPIWRERLDG